MEVIIMVIWMGVILVGMTVSILQLTLKLNPLAVIVFAQVANGLILPIASIFLIVVLNKSKKMGNLANNLKQNLLGIIVVVVVSLLGIWNILKLFLK